MWGMIIITIVAVLVILDTWCYFYGVQKTLSKKVVEWTAKWPLLAFFVGLAVGTLAWHFWPISP